MISITEVENAVKSFLNGDILLQELDNVLRSYMENPEQFRNDNSKVLLAGMVRKIFSCEKIREFYYLMSALFKITGNPEVYYELIIAVTDDRTLSRESKYFAYWQFVRESFVNPSLNNADVDELLDNLYEEVYRDYLEEVKNMCKFIPIHSRNMDLVIVITSQVLSLSHGPTKTLLDRCYILEKKLHKKVFIINTADLLTSNGCISWFLSKVGRYHTFNTDYLEYRDCRFAYMQCPEDIMPDANIIKEILKVIIEEKPWFVVSIGGNNITADLCAQIVPALTVSTVPSKRVQTRTTFQTIGHKADISDLNWLEKHEMKESHFIYGLFTSSFKEQTHHYSRCELGIPDDVVICLVIGWRLDEEIDEEFINVISKISNNDIYTVFIGEFKRYDFWTANDEVLRDHTINLGFMNDVLAVCECCDIYINPRRRGGGTSVAEAMFKGLPPVTIRYGDVATGAGEEFCVDNYDEMTDHIIRLATDKDYYAEMSSKAKSRVALLMDSEGEFVRIIHEMETRKEFW